MSSKALTVFIVALLCLSIFPLSSIPLVNEAGAQPVSESRWISENTYQLKPGTVEIYSGPKAFMNTSTGRFEPIDTTVKQNSTHYYAVKGIYGIYISKNLSAAYPFMISRGNSSLLWKPVNAGYLDKSNYKIQVIRSINTSASVRVNGSEIYYSNFFGRNIDFRITLFPGTFKEELVINHALVTNLPSPLSFGMNPNNTFVGVISNYARVNLNLTNSGLISGNYSSTESVNFVEGLTMKFRLPPSYAWDAQRNLLGSPSNPVKVRNIFTFMNSEKKIASGVPYNWLSSSVGQVVIDPTVTIQPADGDETYFDTLYPTTNNGAASTLYVGDIDNTQNNAARFVIKFNLSSIPSDAVISAATISLYENTAVNSGGLANVNVTVNRLLQNWIEMQATWNNYTTSNPWNTAGAGGSGTDYSATLSTSLIMDAVAANAFVNFTSSQLATDVQYFVNGTWSNYGWRFRSSGEYAGVAQYRWNGFRSSEFGGSTTDPKLIVTYSAVYYLTTYLHTGISALYLNGTSKGNGTLTGYTVGTIANITSVASAGYGFLYYKFNSTYYRTSNPLYWTMNQNYTVDAYAYQIATTTTTTTVTTTLTSTITSTVTNTTTLTTTINYTSTITITTTVTSTQTCTNSTTTVSQSTYYGRETPLMLIFVLIGLTMGAVLVMRRRR